MAITKVYLTKTINLGRRGDRSRIIAEEYIKKNGLGKFSKLIRRLLNIYGSKEIDDPDYKKFKVKELKHSYLEVSKKTSKLANEKADLYRKLWNLGIDPDEFITKNIQVEKVEKKIKIINN